MKVGIIGIGSMGSIIARALLDSGYEVILSERGHLVDDFKNEVKAQIKSNKEVAKGSDYLILAVKPQYYKEVIDEIKEDIKGIFISIAAGQTINKLERIMPSTKIVITMPNTPAKVKEGMSAICPSDSLSQKEIDEVVKIFESFGKAAVIDEEHFDSFSAAAGCLPAYVFMFIEAVSDAAVHCGLKREESYKYISQAVLGSAKMMLESNQHPGKLKDMVTSPKGTTIEGVKTLEEKGFRGAIIDAVISSYEKSKNM